MLKLIWRGFRWELSGYLHWLANTPISSFPWGFNVFFTVKWENYYSVIKCRQCYQDILAKKAFCLGLQHSPGFGRLQDHRIAMWSIYKVWSPKNVKKFISILFLVERWSELRASLLLRLRPTREQHLLSFTLQDVWSYFCCKHCQEFTDRLV